MAKIQKITPHLWFDKNAEEAVKFYTSVFPGSKIGKTARYGKEGYEVHGMPEGTVMTIVFELAGQSFLGLNGGPHFKFNEAVSFMIHCDDQAEIDHYWNKLTEGGDPKAQQCGWLKDRFGLSWQVAPAKMEELMSGNKESAGRVMNAMLKMKKIDLATLQKAADGK